MFGYAHVSFIFLDQENRMNLDLHLWITKMYLFSIVRLLWAIFKSTENKYIAIY